MPGVSLSTLHAERPKGRETSHVELA